MKRKDYFVEGDTFLWGKRTERVFIVQIASFYGEKGDIGESPIDRLL